MKPLLARTLPALAVTALLSPMAHSQKFEEKPPGVLLQAIHRDDSQGVIQQTDNPLSAKDPAAFKPSYQVSAKPSHQVNIKPDYLTNQLYSAFFDLAEQLGNNDDACKITYALGTLYIKEHPKMKVSSDTQEFLYNFLPRAATIDYNALANTVKHKRIILSPSQMLQQLTPAIGP